METTVKINPLFAFRRNNRMKFDPYFVMVTLLSTIFLFVHCDGTPSSSTGCREGYRPFKAKCYKIYSNRLEGVSEKSFEDAKSFCEREGAKLASIHSIEEQDFITAYLGEPSLTNNVWIGLKKNSGWSAIGEKWIDGSDDQNFRNYAPGEPNGGNGESCYHMQSGDNVAGMWNDAGCFHKHGFVCQMNRIGSSLDTSFQQDERCPKGFSYYRDTCFGFIQSEADFWAAEEICETEYDGHLTSIRDNYEEAFLAVLIGNTTANAWIGFSNHLNDLMRGKYAWTDGSHVYHTNWNLGQPPDSSIDGCVADTLDGSGWSVEDCSKKLSFVCSKRFVETSDLGETHLGTCPDGWIDVHNRYCYYIEASNSISYFTALNKCATKAPNGTLAMFESEHDLLLLRPALSEHLTKEFTIGIKQSSSRDSLFEFSNKKPVSYLPWASGEPNQLRSEGCVEVNARTLQYNNYGCSHGKTYICQTNKEVHQTIQNGRLIKVIGVNTTQGEATSGGSSSLSPTSSAISETTSNTVKMRTVSARTFKDNQKTSSTVTYSINTTLSPINKNTDMAHRVSENSGENEQGLSQEAVTLIGVGAVLVVLGLIFITYFVYRRRKLYENPGGGIVRFQNEAD